ncbi:TPA: enoyl-CoA hydratase/isomerase family protein, partial [Burkholderia vietnamiensis]|nr:enoyl-CoA hydratase/isomerase family protein [Burkholderia vietnamiensis]
MTDSTSRSGPAGADTPQPDARAYVANRIGYLELNRPKALNAL